MYIVHVCLEKVILIWCNILFNSIIKNVLLGITSTDYVRMKKYGESFEFKCVNCSSNTVLYFLHEISFYFIHIYNKHFCSQPGDSHTRLLRSLPALVTCIQEILLRSLPALVTCIQEILLHSLPPLVTFPQEILPRSHQLLVSLLQEILLQSLPLLVFRLDVLWISAFSFSFWVLALIKLFISNVSSD